uniref:Uncharacterized protein n=1 Tax=Rhizophora mucronata TaxID=61149 RepID=A0A2P2NKU1_RHIMU
MLISGDLIVNYLKAELPCLFSHFHYHLLPMPFKSSGNVI